MSDTDTHTHTSLTDTNTAVHTTQIQTYITHKIDRDMYTLTQIHTHDTDTDVHT